MHPTRETVAGIEFLKMPGKGEKTVVLFHGYGASAGNLFPLHQINADYTWIFPEGYIRLPYGGRAWFDIDIEALQQHQNFDDAFPEQTEEARTKVQTFLDALKLDQKKMVLGGFSQGGIVATEMVLERFKQCAALVIMSGTLIHEPLWRTHLEGHAGLPFFQSHGRDDPLLPFARAQQLEGLLKEGGFKGALYPFDGGHDIPMEVLNQLGTFLQHIG